MKGDLSTILSNLSKHTQLLTPHGGCAFDLLFIKFGLAWENSASIKGCSGLNSASSTPKATPMSQSLEPVNVTFLGGLIKLRILRWGEHPGSFRWVLNPVLGSLTGGKHRETWDRQKQEDTDTEKRRQRDQGAERHTATRQGKLAGARRRRNRFLPKDYRGSAAFCQFLSDLGLLVSRNVSKLICSFKLPQIVAICSSRHRTLIQKVHMSFLFVNDYFQVQLLPYPALVGYAGRELGFCWAVTEAG